MRIEKLTPPALVRWQSTGGTTPEFTLEPRDGEVLLKFCHGGWERGGDHCHFCNTTWGQLLVCLKDLPSAGCRIFFSLDFENFNIRQQRNLCRRESKRWINLVQMANSLGRLLPGKCPASACERRSLRLPEIFFIHNITRSVCGGTSIQSLDQFELLEAIQRGRWETFPGRQPYEPCQILHQVFRHNWMGS